MQANQEGRPPKRQLNVMNGAVMPGCEEPNRQHSFTVGTVDNGAGARVLPMFELQAETQADQQEWMTTIQVAFPWMLSQLLHSAPVCLISDVRAAIMTLLTPAEAHFRCQYVPYKTLAQMRPEVELMGCKQIACSNKHFCNCRLSSW